MWVARARFKLVFTRVLSLNVVFWQRTRGTRTRGQIALVKRNPFTHWNEQFAFGFYSG